MIHVKIFGIFILLAGLIYITLGSSSLSVTSSAFSGTSSQKKERILRHRRFPVEPIRIVHINNLRKALALGSKFTEEDDWLRNLTLSIKNTSDKTIVFIDIDLHFIKPGAPEDEPIYVQQFFYSPPYAPQESIAPGKKAEIKLTSEDFEMINRYLGQDNYPSGAVEVEIVVDEVKFDDGTFWRSGQFHERASNKDQVKSNSNPLSGHSISKKKVSLMTL
jgi:hypothetical protein